jgi:hypothetical protein
VRPDFFRDTAKGTGIKSHGSLISLGRIDTEFSYGETDCFAAGKRTGHDAQFHIGKASPRLSQEETDYHLVVRVAHPGWLNVKELKDPQIQSLLVAGCETVNGKGSSARCQANLLYW